MTTDEHILLLLQLLERAIVPPEGEHHSISIRNHEGKLVLAFMIEHEGFHPWPIYIERGDQDMHPAACVAAVQKCYDQAFKKETPHD